MAIKQYKKHINLVSDSTEPDWSMWAPSPAECDWQVNTLSALNNGGVWSVPKCAATFKIDKDQCVLVVTQNKHLDDHFFARIVTVCRLVGWDVLEASGGKPVRLPGEPA